MTLPNHELETWLQEMALFVDKGEDPHPEHLSHVLENPDAIFDVLDSLILLDDSAAEERRSYYSACIFAIDLCVAQLQAAREAGSKGATHRLTQFMDAMARAMHTGPQTLSFWLPVLNAFYEVHAELSEELREAYMHLANQEEDFTPVDEFAHLNAIREMILEMSELSSFEIAEQFFAQSYAMPEDFFTDLVADLYSIDEGHEIALLTLLHPKPEVRAVVVDALDYLMPNLLLSSTALGRLQVIRSWYPEAFHPHFDAWIRIQRKKGVVFPTPRAPLPFEIRATEIDGSGAQGIFVHLKVPRANRLCGVLLKLGVGLKDVWLTPPIAARDVKRYYQDAFDETVMLRTVDTEYLVRMVNHFLADGLQRGETAGLHLLELQEALGVDFRPQFMDIEELMQDRAVRISPFTQDTLQQALKRTATWTRTRPFTESWYIESATIDRLVNRCCSFVEGVKVCRFEEAKEEVLAQVFEHDRRRWMFHFFWVALWFEAGHRRGETAAQDSFLVAWAIYNGMPLASIPVMDEICHQTVANSMETMEERRTHLHRE